MLDMVYAARVALARVTPPRRQPSTEHPGQDGAAAVVRRARRVRHQWHARLPEPPRPARHALHLAVPAVVVRGAPADYRRVRPRHREARLAVEPRQRTTRLQRGAAPRRSPQHQ